VVEKTNAFYLPVKRKRDKSYKIQSGELLYTCFTSDFFISDADEWRTEAWQMMKIRNDLRFFIITKRPERISETLPDDWGETGYNNVIIACTVENQDMADIRLPVYFSLPLRYRFIICAPLLGPIELSKYLSESVIEVSAGGESGNEARICDYNWVLAIREQCIANNIPFKFHQTGANFRKEGKTYRIIRKFQHSQARKAGIDYLAGSRYY
jgi:protein gp37